MDLYPVKKLLQEQKAKERAFTFNDTLSYKSRSQASSPTDQSFAKYEGYSPIRHTDLGQKRFDLAYTISFANKQHEKRVDNQVKSISKLDPSLKNVSTTFSGGSMTTSALTPSNRRFVVHLSSPKDQDFYKVPLYQNDIYHLRDKNEKRLQQILNSKEEYKRDYNRIAAKNHFAKFRSGSNVTMENQHRRHNSTMAEAASKNIMILDNDHVVNTNNSMLDIAERDSRAFHNATFQGEVTQSATLSSGLGATFQQRSDSGNNRLLDGLEEIYHQDLQRNEPKEKPVRKSLDMKNKSRKVRKEKGENHTLNLQNYKNYYGDGRLMEKLRDPYAKKLPFEKPLNGNIRNHQIKELAAIETKAEVLRNIKLIDESMRREVNNSPTVKLPQIRDRSKESVKEVDEDDYSEEQIKLLKKSTVSVPSPTRGRSPKSRNSQILAYYVGRNKL